MATSDRIKCDICVIGAGSAGLSVAAGASQMGAKVVLIEKNIRGGVMGGDCLHTGCVPSKALLAAAKQAKRMGNGTPFGIAAQSAQVDFKAVHDHVHDVIATIAPVDSVARFEELGVKVIHGAAEFVSPKEVTVNGTTVRAKYFVLATGSTPATPPIPGIEDVAHFTNETIFDNATLPSHLIIIGGGPIGIEMAQAHRRLGAEVTILEGGTILGKDDPELVDVVRSHLSAEGIDIGEGVTVTSVAQSETAVAVTVMHEGQSHTLEGSHLLVAAGRTPTVSGMRLDAAGVDYSERGVDTDARLRTSNRRIFALGDVRGGLQFTHVAGYDAGIAIRNILYRIPAKADHSLVPWVTYTDPELAHVGLNEADAAKRFGAGKINVLRWPFEENDRAMAERETAGFIKVIIHKNGKILGCSIVGAQAGELIQTWVLAMSQGLKVSALTGFISPYPTLGEISKRAAGTLYTPFLFGARNRFIVRSLLKLP